MMRVKGKGRVMRVSCWGWEEGEGGGVARVFNGFNTELEDDNSQRGGGDECEGLGCLGGWEGGDVDGWQGLECTARAGNA